MSIPPGTPPRRVLATREDLCEALQIGFSDQQLDAITAPLEPAVIIAGAGSGKTTVMAARVVWLVGTGAVRPEQILGLTFTRKAAAELSARVRAALARSGAVPVGGADTDGEQLVMTYDAFANRLVSEHGLRLGFDADPRMISGATRYRVASRVVRAAAGPFEQLTKFHPATVTDRVLQLDAELQSHLVDPARLYAHAADFQRALDEAPPKRGGNPYVDIVAAAQPVEQRLELAGLVAGYQRIKAELGLVEFADQMAIAARLAAEVPEVSAAVRDSFRVVLLDEYQDTSAAQAAMLHGLFSGAAPAQGRGHPVTAVGDPFQAIYGWRGAAASNILAFANEFLTAADDPAPAYSLTVNRRSGQSILDVANGIAASLKSDVAGDTDLIAPPENGRGRVFAASFATWPEEVSWIADRITAARTGEEVAAWSDVAVLTRRNEDIAAVFAELTRREVPAEIVGLGGLLRLPEVSDVVSVLTLLDDVTANPSLVRLLTGARWRIGGHDVALLGRRARQLAVERRPERAAEPAGLARAEQALDEAVADVDPTEVTSLLDALEDPGPLPYSEAARRRFAELAHELAQLRRHGGEPVLDLTRRVIASTGLDVELMATSQFYRVSRRDQLAAFVDAVADYVDVDGEASLSGLLGYLQAELDTGNGLDQAVPSDADAVKLLTVHRAKGLEWELVFLPALVNEVFPSSRVTDNWVKNAAALPRELRGDADSIAQLEDVSNDGFKAFAAELRAEHARSEDRLGYVAVTRAKRTLIGTAHAWRASTSKPRTPSGYFDAILAEATAQERVVRLAEPPAPGASNPLTRGSEPVAWPAPLDPDSLARRRQAAAAVSSARSAGPQPCGATDAVEAEQLLLDEESRVAAWDHDLELLLAEARRHRRPVDEVRMPAGLSATDVLRLTADPQGFAAQRQRPMPRRPVAAARFGTRFHRWVEQHFGQAALIDPEELLDSADPGVEDDADLLRLAERFRQGRFAQRTPMLLEEPFSMMIGDQPVFGRIDAVFRDLDPADGFRYQVVDWKTGRGDSADPLQLAIYRLAWAERVGLPVSAVDACFYFVRSDTLTRPERLPQAEEVIGMLRAATGASG